MTAAKLFGGLGGGLWGAHPGVQDGHRAWRGQGEMAGYKTGNWGKKNAYKWSCFTLVIAGVPGPIERERRLYRCFQKYPQIIHLFIGLDPLFSPSILGVKLPPIFASTPLWTCFCLCVHPTVL